MIGEVKTWVDLVKLGRIEYDFILERDWSSTHHASVDCLQKRVNFKMEGIPEFTFEGVIVVVKIQIISAIMTTKLLRRGCQRFLAVVIDKKKTELKMEGIAIV